MNHLTDLHQILIGELVITTEMFLEIGSRSTFVYFQLKFGYQAVKEKFLNNQNLPKNSIKLILCFKISV